MGFIPFTFVDVIDIVLVASLLYGVYRAMRGTSAPYIIMGIFIIYLVWILVKTFNLVLFSTILGQIISVVSLPYSSSSNPRFATFYRS